MKKMFFSLLFCMILISSKSFAGSIPEDLLHSDEAHIFFGEVVAYNADKDIEVFITEKIKGPITERTGRIYYNPNTVGDFKVKEGKKYLFTYFDENNPTDIFEVTSFDTSTLKLKNVEGDMWERFEKYLNQGRYLDAEHARIDSVNDKIPAEGEDISFVELLGVNNENAQSIEIFYKGNVFKPNISEFYKAVDDIKLRNIEDVGLNPETGMTPQEALDGMYITVNGMEGFLFITDDCKVDKYCMAMSRMPMGDYTIKFEEYVRIRNFTITDEEKAELPFLETEQARNLFFYIPLFIILGVGVIALIYGIIKKKKLFIVVGIIPICWLALGIVDFSLVHNYKKPIFCIGVNTADDGGSGTYKGLGYSFELEGNFMPETENPGVTSYKGYVFSKEVSRGFWEKQIWNEEDKDKLIYGYQVDDTGKTLNSSEMKKHYIEFAMDNRIDFIPNFDENTYKGNNPISTEDFLMLTYYMNEDKLSEDLSMTTELVENVMRENFGIEKVEHKSQFKGWTYDKGKNKYTPYPEGTAEESIFDVINFNIYNENDKKIYDVTLREYRLPYVFSKDDTALSDTYNSYFEYTEDEENEYRENVLFLLAEKGEEIKNAEINIYNAMYDLVVEDNTDGFTVGNTIRIKYYIDETTGKPRFIYKSEELFGLQ